MNTCSKGKQVEGTGEFDVNLRKAHASLSGAQTGLALCKSGLRREKIQMIASCCEDNVRNVKSVFLGNAPVWFK